MTIRLQNLLVIPPIFLILGLAVGVLADRAARDEILWGLEEESVALAVTVAAMVDGPVFEALVNGDAEEETRVRAALDRIGEYGQLESVILYSRPAGVPILSWNIDSAGVSLEPGLWEQYVGELEEQTVFAGVRAWGPYPEAFAAGALIGGSAAPGEAPGAVAVVIDASRWAVVIGALRRTFALLVLLVTSIGVVAALFLSLRIGRQVTELSRVGASVAAGDYGAAVEIAGVKEVRDLSNTLGTMASILADVLSRGRRALVVGDPFQVAQGMAVAYREARMASHKTPTGVDIGVSDVGKIPPGCFHGWTESDVGAVFWVGRVGPGNTLDMAVEAAAANRALRSRIREGVPDEAGACVRRLFDLTSLQLAWFGGAGAQGSQLSVAAGTGAPIESGDYTLIHSFHAEQMQTLFGSISLFKDLPAEEASAAIRNALPRSYSGTILLLRPSGPRIQETRRDQAQ
jgi:HAMP domain-containing protein